MFDYNSQHKNSSCRITATVTFFSVTSGAFYQYLGVMQCFIKIMCVNCYIQN
jgi:hypothetical protein